MWFSASLFFESIHSGPSTDNPPAESLWEESILLIHADTEEEARQKAELLGKAEEVEYESANGDTVRWTFQRVERVHEILDASVEDGTEVFSRFLRASEVESILTPFPDGPCDSHVRAESP